MKLPSTTLHIFKLSKNQEQSKSTDISTEYFFKFNVLHIK